MTDDEMLAARRGLPIQGFVDLAVGRIDADLEHLDQHGAAVADPANVRMGLVVQLRDRNISQMNAIRLAGQDGNGFHREVA